MRVTSRIVCFVVYITWLNLPLLSDFRATTVSSLNSLRLVCFLIYVVYVVAEVILGSKSK